MRETLTYRQLARMTKEKIERLQNMKLRATARYMLPHTKFYSNLFKEYGVEPEKIRKISDWKQLPLIKKATYMKKPEDFIVKPGKDIFNEHLKYLHAQDETAAAAEILFSARKELKNYYTPKMLIFSGGTESGMPTPVALTAKQKFDNLTEVLQIIGEMMLKKVGDRMTTGMNLFPYAPHLGWHAVHQALDLNADLNLCTAAGGAMRTERLVMMADKLKPNIICGMNSYLRNKWLPLAIKNKIKLPEQVVFINGAQKMHEAEREKIVSMAKKLGVRKAVVYDMYGASELKEALLPECRPGSGFHHIAPLSTILKTIEVRETDKELITEWDFTENGYAASWNIDGAGTLLEGYIIGDHYGKITYDKCKNCGLSTMRLFEINRISEVEAQLQLTGMVEAKVKGTRVNLSAMRDDIIKMPEIEEAQLIVDKKGQLTVSYTAKTARAGKKLQEYFKKTEITPKLKKTQEPQQDEMKLRGIIIQNK